ATVLDGDDHQDVVGGAFGILDRDIEVAAVLEEAEILELDLAILRAERARSRDELAIGEGALRILVQISEVAPGRRRVLVEINFFQVLAVVALGPAQAEGALFQDRILLVPERDREAEELVAIAEASEAILAPAVRAAPGVVVGEVVPGVSARAVVLAHRAPGALREVRPPLAPAHDAVAILGHASVLGGRVCAEGHARTLAEAVDIWVEGALSWSFRKEHPMADESKPKTALDTLKQIFDNLVTLNIVTAVGDVDISTGKDGDQKVTIKPGAKVLWTAIDMLQGDIKT